MTKSNQDYKNAALAALKGNWGKSVGAALVVLLFAAAFGGTSAWVQTSMPKTALLAQSGTSLGFSILTIFVVNPLVLGLANAFKLLLTKGEDQIIGNSFGIGFSSHYLHKVGGLFLVGFKTFLWCLLLFIPGIIMSFAYAMTPYILEENPELSAWEASALSRKMMKGHKFDLFFLRLSFIGWSLLCLLTLGIGFLWLIPYQSTTVAGFWEDVKAEYNAKFAV